MLFIGERINTGFKKIKQAVLDKDPKPLQQAARRQIEAGANYLDVNLGAISADPAVMCWMIEAVQAAVDAPISIDSNKPDIVAQAIKVCRKPPIINSTTAAKDKLEAFMAIAAAHKASIIGLSIDESGTPTTAAQRVENAGKILAKAMEMGVPTENVFLDPITMPLKFMQEQALTILDATRQFAMLDDPPPKIICGLSNISNKTEHKELINRTFLVMAIACGMSATICNVEDVDLMNAVRCAEFIMNREIYADSFVKTPEPAPAKTVPAV
jgi:5-methyltetrahydrofolate corrinoid/iron sulfur protein methyltransferase